MLGKCYNQMMLLIHISESMKKKHHKRSHKLKVILTLKQENYDTVVQQPAFTKYEKTSTHAYVCNIQRYIRRAATRENRSSGFPTRSDTNRPVQAQKRARSLKFRISVEEELYYPSSENKGADQLRSYCEADLRLCFRIGNNPVFSRCGSNNAVEWIK